MSSKSEVKATVMLRRPLCSPIGVGVVAPNRVVRHAGHLGLVRRVITVQNFARVRHLQTDGCHTK